ncbi:MAG TPA: PQQ-dependent dehydrogenase, methanol/ethanol family [Pseudolabrys sp.]|nr:PQQ-dependent dehydrogenase, methanol/ethanol family [Pseudolabrys sp.]
MKTFVLAACVLLLLGSGTAAQTFDDLKKDGNGGSADNILTYGMGYHQQRYSPLKQINKQSIKRLVPVWSLSLDNNWGEQAQPIIYNDVMYVTNAKATVAIDVATGKQIWKQALDWPPETPRVVCCGVSNKGAAIYNGKVFRTTLDAHVIAYDAKNGKELWKSKAAEWREGFSLTVAPLVVNGVLVTGISGAEFGIRGFIDGWDTETGKHLWRRYTIPARAEKGNETWPQNNNAWEVGGGSAWITGSYDPELDLMYWGIGNPAPWASQSRDGDNLYTSSVLAMRPATGEIVWYYQFTPNDAYDYDACWELINADIDVGGQKRKVIMQLNRNGFLYVIDRTNGKLLAANAFEKVNWASHVDKETGRPIETEIAKSIRAGKATEHWPSTRGGKNWPHAAFNPETGLLYANTLHEGRMYKHLEIKPHVVGQRYQFIENLPLPRAADEPLGHMEAIDPLTAQKKWRTPLMDFQIWSAMLATGGGLLFTGKETGEFIAVDADTGKIVWQFQTGSGINAMPVTYTHQGRQYVTVLSGIGGLYWNIAREQLKDKVPQGGSVWTFALLPE